MLVLACLALSAPGAGATTQQQLDRATAHLHRLQHGIHDARIHLHEVKREIHQARVAIRALQGRLNELAARVSEAEGAFENTRARIHRTHASLAKTEARYTVLRVAIDRRARALYEEGPGSNLELLFSSTSLSDLTDRAEFVGAINSQDADLALRAQRVADALKIKQQELNTLRAREKRQLDRLHVREAKLDAKFAEQQQLLTGLDAKRSYAESLISKLDTRRSRILKVVSVLKGRLAAEARALAAALGNVRFGGSEPVTLDHPFATCPVAGPHGYSDSFGAPRYAGGYHPHAGNDIFAPRDTPIVAPFDGYASRDPNGLGGNAVIVRGAAGYVYNAHLDHYGTTGSVSAGTVIGYVGNSGDARGGATHDHFEWHPDHIPAQLWRSPYGYTLIGSAVDPFPYLNQVC